MTVRKWKAKIAVENPEYAIKMKEIIDIVANRRAGLGIHPIELVLHGIHNKKKNGFERNSS